MFHALDHVALVVRDLADATARYRTLLGCEPNWRGADGGAEHVRFQLDNVALDIASPTGSGTVGDRVRAQLERQGEGILALAFATTDIAKARHVLGRRGISSTEPQLVRSIDVDSNESRAWRTSELASEATFGTTIFLVEQEPAAPPNPRSMFGDADSSRVSALDHVVITTAHPERAIALYGARLDLDMKLDRTNPDWGSRLMFFKCGNLIVEIAHNLKNSDPIALDRAWGLSWRVKDVAAANARLKLSGIDVSEVRAGRKPGTQVFTVRDTAANVPTLVIGRVAI